MEYLQYILPVIAVVFFVSLPYLKKKAKETETVIDDKILTLIAQWLKKFLPKK